MSTNTTATGSDPDARTDDLDELLEDLEPAFQPIEQPDSLTTLNTGIYKAGIQAFNIGIHASGTPGNLDHAPRTHIQVYLPTEPEGEPDRLADVNADMEMLADDLSDWVLDQLGLEGDLDVVFQHEPNRNPRLFQASVPRQQEPRTY